MDKGLTGRDGAVLGIDSCTDLYEKLKFEGERLGQEWHPYDAFNFVVTAWHLYNDWLPKDRTEKPKLTGKKTAREKLPQEMILVLDVLRDIANSSKHLQLELGSAEKRQVSETHNGEIDNHYSYFHHEGIPGVTTEGDYYFSIRKLRNICLAYFAWVFDDRLSASPFPGELLWDIWRCAAKNRVEGVLPPPGAIPGELGDPDFVS